MNIQQEYTIILEKEKEERLLPFLKSVPPEQKKEFSSFVKTLLKPYLDHQQVQQGNTITFRQKASPVQSRILTLTAFVCLGRKDFEKIGMRGDVVSKKVLDQVLPWYCPPWFSDYINSFRKQGWLPYNINYLWMVELYEKGYFTPSKEIIVMVLPQMIFEHDGSHNWTYKPENLTKSKITLDEHIWYLFEFESSINHSDKHQYLNLTSVPDHAWMQPLKDFSIRGQLDRTRLLRETLLATNRNFNKTLAGWFAELFVFLEPSTDELLALQRELLSVLNSPHSKPVNVALNVFKKLTDVPDFDSKEFLDSVSLLLASETKAVVTGTLQILDKLARKKKTLTEQITLAATLALMHNEEDIQSRAARIIVKFGTGFSDQLIQAIDPYKASLLMSTKTLLAEYLPPETEPNVNESSDFSYASSPDGVVKIPLLETLDEVVFLASQAFDNNQPHHIDVLPAALIKFHNQFTGEAVAKLEPALQRAYQLIMGDWRSTVGYLDHLLASFFIDFAEILIKRNPLHSIPLSEVRNKFFRQDQEFYQKNPKYYQPRIGRSVSTWSTVNKDTMYHIHKAILVEALRKIQSNDPLPLLSTPDQEPAIIEASTLVERLSLYEQARQSSSDEDLQVAISRCRIEHVEDVLSTIAQKLSGEYLKLVQFLLTPDAEPAGPFAAPSVWYMAGLRKNPGRRYDAFASFPYAALPEGITTGRFPWTTIEKEFMVDRYDFVKRKPHKVPETRKILDIKLNAEKKDGPAGIFKNLLNKWKEFKPGNIQAGHQPLIYEYLSFKAKFLSAEQNDIQRILYLFPFNPEPVLAHVAGQSFMNPAMAGESDRRLVIATWEGIMNLKWAMGEASHLFVATSMISSDKTIRAFAAEFWIREINNPSLNSTRIGEILAVHESIEFAPLKRFTDLVGDSMLHISKSHDRALQEMLTSLIAGLPREPIANLKKLLETYAEVISANGAIVDTKLNNSLRSWKSGSLTKIVTSLEAKLAVV